MTKSEKLPDISEVMLSLSPEFSEDALALQFTAKYGDSLRYVETWKSWFSWTGSVWQKEETLEVFDLARGICREAAIKVEKDSLKAKLSDAHTVAAVERFARADRKFATTTAPWDADPFQLNTPAGTIDLQSGKMSSHTPANLHRKIAGASFSDKRPELWLNFLDRVTCGDTGLQTYLQRVAGYCLTGSTQEHALFFCYGTGSNGKSVFTSTLLGIMGDYARPTPVETFTEHHNEQHPCAIAALQGVRLALTSETERNSRWAESKLKALTGGDKITARYMRGNFFDFPPQFKIVVAGNHRPRLSSVDEAIRRRMHLIPWTVTIAPEERDSHLTEKLKAEWPAILGWAVAGCLAWQRDGLRPPTVVIDATDAYLSGEDKIGLWLDARCLQDRHSSAGSTSAFQDYRTWCEAMNEQPGSQRTFSQELLSRQGISIRKGMNGNSFVGIGLKSDSPEAEP